MVSTVNFIGEFEFSFFHFYLPVLSYLIIVCLRKLLTLVLLCYKCLYCKDLNRGIKLAIFCQNQRVGKLDAYCKEKLQVAGVRLQAVDWEYEYKRIRYSTFN